MHKLCPKVGTAIYICSLLVEFSGQNANCMPISSRANTQINTRQPIWKNPKLIRVFTLHDVRGPAVTFSFTKDWPKRSGRTNLYPFATDHLLQFKKLRICTLVLGFLYQVECLSLRILYYPFHVAYFVAENGAISWKSNFARCTISTLQQ